MSIFSLIPHPIIKNKHAHKKQEVQIPPTPKAIYIWFPFSFYAFCSSAYCQNQYMNHPFWLTIYSFPDEAVSSVQIDPKNEMRVGWGAALETWKHLRHQKPMHKVKWYSLNWFHFWHCIPSSQFYFFTHVLKSESCLTISDFKSDLTEIGCDSRRLKYSITVLWFMNWMWLSRNGQQCLTDAVLSHTRCPDNVTDGVKKSSFKICLLVKLVGVWKVQRCDKKGVLTVVWKVWKG